MNPRGPQYSIVSRLALLETKIGGCSLENGAGTTLTNFVYEASPTGNLNQPQKAYAAAFVLLLMVLAMNAAVDVVHRRARKVGTWSS